MAPRPAVRSDVQPVTYNNGVPVSATLRIPTDRRNSIDMDMGIYAQDHWTFKRDGQRRAAARHVPDVHESRDAAGQRGTPPSPIATAPTASTT